MDPVRLVTLAPGHFHAALIQKEMQPDIDRTVHVFAPLDADLAAHVGRIAAFNARAANPTSWRMNVHAGDDWSERFRRERPGNVAVLSGRNRAKIDWMQMAIGAGMHVLADKPWIIEAADFSKLRSLLDSAERAGLIVHDMMTERFEITSILQREIVNDRDLFGAMSPGSPEQPGIWMESVHYLKKQVAGVPLRRPGWFFDIRQEGEALADVGTHLVDLVMWTLFQDRPIDYSREVAILEGRRWPTVLNRDQFESITGLPSFPPECADWVDGERLSYFCNNRVMYCVRGVHVRLDVLWDYEATAGGGDTHHAVYRGEYCSAEIRQRGGQAPELFVVPVEQHTVQVADALRRLVERWQEPFSGVQALERDGDFQLSIPERYRIGHEAHFAQVTAEFLRFLREPSRRPAWETAHLLAKYHTTTQGVARARG